MARMALQITDVDDGVFQDKVGNQISAATSPSIGDLVALWMADGGSDIGVWVTFDMPGFSGTPAIVTSFILDGAPGASDVFAQAIRKRAVAIGEAGDGTFDAEETDGGTTIGSSGAGHSNEDIIEGSTDLTGANYTEGDRVLMHVYLDASVMTYAGNIGLLEVMLDYTPA